MTTQRPLYEIGNEIWHDWGKKMYFGARPYVTALCSLESMSHMYGADTGSTIVAYFLANAQTWRGPVARAIKAELNAMLKGAN